MKFSVLLVLILFTVAILNAESTEKYSQIKIFVKDENQLKQIWNTGIDFEGSSGKIGNWMQFVASKNELEQLSSQGITYIIIEDDLSRKYSQQLIRGPVNALGFGYGSMSGYYTYQEVKQQLDSMKSLYPYLITSKDSIGSSAQNRAIWIVKISSNPTVYDPNKPEVLYTALHHAREPEGMMTVLYYMWWLLENYNKDSSATYLINHRQMYFIPVVNPDGYYYNESTNPSGGGMWRKNRRNNGDGTYGVDLNRNYGPYEMWNSPYGGSSTSTFSETYRGPSPFSEPEIYSIAQFVSSHTIVSCLNYHTYGNYLIYPWGYQPSESNDSVLFREFAFDMVKDNRYLSGTDMQTVQYVTRGGSDDYMYGGSYFKTFAMTPEVGSSGFWPPTYEIFPLAEQNLSSNKYCAFIAGQYSILKKYKIIDSGGENSFESGHTFSLSLTLQNKGLSDAKNLEVNINANSPLIQFSESTKAILLLQSRADSDIVFTGNILYSQSNTPVQLFINIIDADRYLYQDTITSIIGKPLIIFSDSASIGITNWTTGTSWGTTSVAHTPPYSFTDSPSGNYSANEDNSLTLNRTLNLTPYEYVFLDFWTKWSIEPTYDFATIEVSSDGGASWNVVKTKLSHRGSGAGVQLNGTWGFDGYNPGMNWVEQEADLSQYVSKQISLRFRLKSDNGEQRDGWYIDDIQIIGYQKASPTLAVKDNGTDSDILVFGELPNATSGIDNALGETTIGPKPASGIFDARWKIDGTNGTKINYLKTLENSDSSNIFTADIQPGIGGYPMVLSWSQKFLPTGAWHLRDAATHGRNFDVNMLLDSTQAITSDTIESIEIIHTLTDTFSLTFNEGWQLISLPVIVENRSKQFLFPGVPDEAFGYDHSYYQTPTIENHNGYWLKFPSIMNFKLVGIPIMKDTIQVPSGWWLVNGLGCSIQPFQVLCDNPPCPVYKYSSGYHSDLAVEPGEGFWMKGPQTLTLSCFNNSTAKPANIVSRHLNESSKIEIIDNSGRKSTLFFGSEQNPITSLENFDLPPIPPPGSFDVRFASNRIADNISGRNNILKIILQTDSYPITIRWNLTADSINSLELTDNQNGNLIGHRSMTLGSSLTIRNPEVTSLLIGISSHKLVPQEFSLEQNYPNPFNPSTTIDFNIPLSSLVTLKVFDPVGKEVRTLMKDQSLPSGHYKVAFDGSDLTSGVYFYRMSTKSLEGNRIQQFAKKMLLLK